MSIRECLAFKDVILVSRSSEVVPSGLAVVSKVTKSVKLRISRMVAF